jgi:hypothetical protein
VLILLAAASLAWVALLSLGFVFLMSAGASAGWIIAGVLFFSLVVWAVVMSGEFRGAIEMPEASEFIRYEDPRPHPQDRMEFQRTFAASTGFRHGSQPAGRRSMRHVRTVGSLSRRPARRRPNRSTVH